MNDETNTAWTDDDRRLLADEPGVGIQLDHNVIRTAPIIAVAMILGILVFAGVALVIGPQGEDGFIALLCGGLALPPLALRAIWPIVSERIAEKTPTDKIERLWQTHLIVQLALADGACFLLTVGYLMSGELMLLAGVGLVLVWILVQFPTPARFFRFIENAAITSQFTDDNPPPPQ